MNQSIELATRQYYSIVKLAIKDFFVFLKESQSIDINSKYELFDFLRNTSQTTFILDEKTYRFHGIGCSVWKNDKQIIAWDFGYRSWLCGINPFKMALTLSNSESYLEECFDAGKVSDLCKAEVEKGNMTEHFGQYYVNLLSLETSTLSLPIEYDSLIVEQNSKQYKYIKSKAVDRFIRKSNKVYRYIDELENNLVLVFMKDNVEIGRYFYNDIAYPDSAVRIMDELLRLKQLH